MDSETLFWAIAEDLIVSRGVEEGTMMGHRCLRSDGSFAAMVDRKHGGLVVKLSSRRVDELVASGTGESFAPAGKVFREWVLVSQPDQATWTDLMTEAVSGQRNRSTGVSRREVLDG